MPESSGGARGSARRGGAGALRVREQWQVDVRDELLEHRERAPAYDAELEVFGQVARGLRCVARQGHHAGRVADEVDAGAVAVLTQDRDELLGRGRVHHVKVRP